MDNITIFSPSVNEDKYIRVACTFYIYIFIIFKTYYHLTVLNISDFSGHFLVSSLNALNECTRAKFYVAISLYVSTDQESIQSSITSDPI